MSQTSIPADQVRPRPRIREFALFEQLEEVARALIARTDETRTMSALLDAATIAFGEGRYNEARAKLAELHFFARHARLREGPRG